MTNFFAPDVPTGTQIVTPDIFLDAQIYDVSGEIVEKSLSGEYQLVDDEGAPMER